MISSSGLGFGHGSLQRDTDEISKLMEYLIRHHHADKFALIGHSTGCQNAIHLTKYGESALLEKLKCIVLQAPVSDREGAMVDNPKSYESNIQHAKQLQAQGREEEMMPRNVFWAPITAYRFLSLQEKGGDDDYFSSDYTDEELIARLKHVSQCGTFFGLRALVAFSKEDEYVPEYVDKDLILKRLCDSMNAECSSSSDIVATPLMLEESNHNLSNDEEDRVKFVDAVKKILAEI
jgi:pimeloyl-ACP methyl ester carboxylesterase